MNLQDATTRVRRAIEVITPEFDPEPPMAFVKLSERQPGIFDVTLTDDAYLASIHDVTVRHVLGAQIGTVTHESNARPVIETYWGPRIRLDDSHTEQLVVRIGGTSGRLGKCRTASYAAQCRLTLTLEDPARRRGD